MVRTYLNQLLLPVNPFDDITIRYKANNKQYEILDLGDVTVIGARRPRELTIKSVFTDNTYPFSVCEPLYPAKRYVDAISGWMEQRQPIRFLCVGDGIDVNLPCSIEDFEPSHHYGETNEYYYTLNLKEYRQPRVTRIILPQPVPLAAQPAAAKTVPAPAATAPAAKTYTVKSGDCLYSIAKLFYGSGSKYPQIVSANKDKIKNPNLILPGWVLTIP